MPPAPLAGLTASSMDTTRCRGVDSPPNQIRRTRGTGRSSRPNVKRDSEHIPVLSGNRPNEVSQLLGRHGWVEPALSSLRQEP